MKFRTTILALTAAALAVPAVAADGSVGVKYSDLDLTTEQGQEVLARRIDEVARAICGVDKNRTGTILPNSRTRECVERAKASAHEQVAERVARGKARG